MPDLSLFPPSATIAGDDLQVGGCSLRPNPGKSGTKTEKEGASDRASGSM